MCEVTQVRFLCAFPHIEFLEYVCKVHNWLRILASISQVISSRFVNTASVVEIGSMLSRKIAERPLLLSKRTTSFSEYCTLGLQLTGCDIASQGPRAWVRVGAVLEHEGTRIGRDCSS